MCRKLAIVLLALASPAWGQLPAFPGAEGFGAFATGGRGGHVIYVTNLNTSGPGSFQWALDQAGPRYILFKVSGLINGSVQLTSSDVTIAGQTSPGGIIVRGFHTTEEPYIDQVVGRINDPDVKHAENWILRHIRTRPAGAGLDDGVRARYTKNAIIDHCSIANASDEAFELSFATRVTIQNCMLSETLGGHAQYGGMLINYSNPADGFPLTQFSIHHNMWNRINGRMPEIARDSPAAGGTTMDIELANNLLWDAGFYITVARTTGYPGGLLPVFYHFNWIGNRIHVRPDFPYGAIDFQVNDPNYTTVYFADDTMNLYPSRHEYGLSYCCNDYPTATVSNAPFSFAIASRHAFPSITYMPSIALYSSMQVNAGAFPRDPMDRRLLEALRTGVIDPTPRGVNPHGDAFAHDWTTPPAPPEDTDSDGMPDDWETAHGLNSNVDDHNGTNLSAVGYTNIEVYLNELADRLVTGGNGNRAPSANAGADQAVTPGVRVALDGAASSDPDHDPITYTWNQEAGPGIVLDGSGTSAPTFIGPAAGGVDLRFRLTVSDGQLSSSDDVVVSVSAAGGGNRAPSANAGADQAVAPGALVRLDGSASSDPDHDPITYTWNQEAGPGVVLDGSGTSAPTFTTPAAGGIDLGFQVTVSDGQLSSSDDVVISVTAVSSQPYLATVTSRTGRPGARATLRGSGFTTDRSRLVVWFGSKRAKVQSASATKIVVTIPRTLSSGATVDVHVDVGGVESNSVAFKLR